MAAPPPGARGRLGRPVMRCDPGFDPTQRFREGSVESRQDHEEHFSSMEVPERPPVV